ncbi:hypothetical protein TNCV_1249041 [Trichonephila clavipes]|nr:hypothetical protein TNCV_1249041 [Trichonephila clavipes]
MTTELVGGVGRDIKVRLQAERQVSALLTRAQQFISETSHLGSIDSLGKGLLSGRSIINTLIESGKRGWECVFTTLFGC